MSCFDKVVERRGTGCYKWDGHALSGIPEDAIPMWVADMDFEIAPQISEAIRNRARHEVYGYTKPTDTYNASVAGWMKRRHDWKIRPEWVVPVPGVVPAVNLAITAFTKPGDGVLIQRPVYHPFANAIAANGRKLVNNPLVLRDGKYSIDIEDFRAKIAQEDVKLFILCSPHNPVGRVWSREELKAMADICLEHGVLIVSDEIHQDLAFPGTCHIPLPLVDSAYADISIVCTAPSKTFNLAGLQASNILIPNPELRIKYEDMARSWGLFKLNTFGMVACEAAYDNGDQWLDEALAYIKGNMEFVRDFLESCLPQIKLIEPEGLFLLWLDFRELGLATAELENLLINDARLWLIPGQTFGEEGEGFVRMNIACSRSILESALERLAKALKV